MIYQCEQFHDIKRYLKVATGPTEEPVSVDDCKQYLRVDFNDEDNLISSWITTAREMVERDSARALLTQTLELRMDAFPERTIYLERLPVQSVSSVQYVDTGGTTTTLASSNYVTDLTTEPARIQPAYGLIWPFTRYQSNAVIVTFVAGYSSVAAVPEIAKQLIKVMVCHWFQRPESCGSADEFWSAYWAMIGRIQWSQYA